MSGVETRPRKSRFDVGPDLAAAAASGLGFTPQLQLETDIFLNSIEGSSSSSNVERPTVDAENTDSANKKSRFSDDTVGVSFHSEPYAPTNDEALMSTPSPFYGSYEVVMRDKLAKALVKNFEYLIRKDALACMPKPPPSAPIASVHVLANPSNPLQGWVVPSSSRSTSVPSASLSVPNIQSAPSSSSIESVSVYVSGFPLDFEEEDLNILFSPHGKIKRVKLYGAVGQRKGDALVTFVRPEPVLVCCKKLNGLDLGEGYLLQVSKATFAKGAEGAECTSTEGGMSIEGAGKRADASRGAAEESKDFERSLKLVENDAAEVDLVSDTAIPDVLAVLAVLDAAASSETVDAESVDDFLNSLL